MVKLKKQEIVDKVKEMRKTYEVDLTKYQPNIEGEQKVKSLKMNDSSYISEQAIGMIKLFPDFDIEEFIKWWHVHSTLGNIGGSHVIQYIEWHHLMEESKTKEEARLKSLPGQKVGN